MKYLQTEVITFVLLLLVSLFHHQFVPNLYQCHAIHEKTAMPMTGRFHIIREPPAYSSNLLYGSPNLPEHINHHLRPFIVVEGAVCLMLGVYVAKETVSRNKIPRGWQFSAWEDHCLRLASTNKIVRLGQWLKWVKLCWLGRAKGRATYPPILVSLDVLSLS